MRNILLPALAALGLTGCAIPPLPRGPTIVAMPPQGRDFGQFQREDAFCQQTAAANLGLNDPQAITQSALGSAAIGTAVGAAAGALIGAATGNAGAGAAIGAGAGLLTGSAVGANAAQNTNFSLQERYDVIYAQCMSSYGNSIQPIQVGVPVPTPYPYAYGPAVGFGFGYPYAYPRPYGGYYGRGYYRRW
ncbi:glycine zipper family protein [Sediminicoccus sp. KRV36]|uniref:glycine zipper family protein n=1 Tax=Sediminicoccus sp. KRV36 TaxID=3133721 RepID=UPI00200F4394|nr:glycine zipper family protein [Sediminicoccus rosea]UPY37549.1 glycine zipper family protein [Sediminicoccus rosea]